MATSATERVVTGTIWAELTARIARLADVVLRDDTPADAHLRAEGFRYLTRFLAAGIAACIAHDDTDAPSLGRIFENRMSWGLDNPDCLYTYTRVAGDGVHRLIGRRGSARAIEFQVNTGHFGDGNFTGWKAVSVLSGDDLVQTPSGDFEITLGGEPIDGNWLALGPDASFLLIRQYFGDWETERPADLSIERVDVPLPSPPYGPERLAEQLDLLMTWLETGARCWADLGVGIASGEPDTITPFLPPADAAGLKGQAYGMGPYRCAPDQAVILEFTPPPCRLWSVSLSDWFWQSMEFATRQSSLNDAQARRDADGACRLVIAQADPGVPNWLDACGFERGTVAVRYLLPEHVPVVTYTTVPLAELRSHLPADTPHIDSGARDAILRRRSRAVAGRYRR